jgi:hypothetical protein
MSQVRVEDRGAADATVPLPEGIPDAAYSGRRRPTKKYLSALRADQSGLEAKTTSCARLGAPTLIITWLTWGLGSQRVDHELAHDLIVRQASADQPGDLTLAVNERCRLGGGGGWPCRCRARNERLDH